MDKGRKLKRYGRKDYTQLVEFPVEIIGRDGVVRRYDFEQSIRLYQRRIASAGLRYADVEIVHAEVNHCRLRIEQLRRSYFVRCGWPALEQLSVDGLSGPGLAADVAAFLKRCLGRENEEYPPVELVKLENEGRRSHFFLRLAAETEGDGLSQRFLVYIHSLDTVEDCPQRSRFFEELKTLQRQFGGAQQVESLVAFYHTGDCGLILTQVGGPPLLHGVEEEVDPASRALTNLEPPADFDLSPDQRACQLLRQGRHRAALRRFIAEYESSPLNRRAYLGAIVAADLIGAVSLAESAALMGSRVLGSDVDLRYHLVAVYLRQRRWSDAEATLKGLEDLSPGDPRIGLLRATLAAGQRQYRASRRCLDAAVASEGVPRQLRASQRSLVAQLVIRRVLLLSSVFVVLSGLTMEVWFEGWGLGVALAGTLIALSSEHACRRLFLRSLSHPGSQGLRLVDIACLARGKATGFHQV